MRDWFAQSTIIPLSTALAAGALLVGCNSGGGGSSGSGGTGTASFAVTDAPVDNVSEVNVTFDAIELQPADGERIRLDLDEPKQVDLLALQGENYEPLIEDAELPAGEYNWIRLYVVSDNSGEAGVEASHVIDEEGGQYPLYVPGNQPPSQNPNQRWIQLSSPFVVPVDDVANFTIDVDLRKALVRTDNPPQAETFYMIRPSLRIVDNQDVGTLFGTVEDSLLMDDVCENDPNTGAGNAVYVYRGFDATPGDVLLDEEGEVVERDGISHPVTTANVRQDEIDGETGNWYTVGFLTEGEYTVAFTCQGLGDDPEADDLADLDLTPVYNVTVEAGERTRQDFTAE